MTSPHDLRAPARDLAELLDAHTGTHAPRARVNAVWSAARVIRVLLPASVSTTEVVDVINVAHEHAGTPPAGRTARACWVQALADDLAVRLAWLGDPTADEAICGACGDPVSGARGDLTTGTGWCPACGEDTHVTIPGPVFSGAVT